ncbi:mucin-5AC-like [Sander vitreus]
METPTTSEPPISTPCPGGHDVTCEWSEWINHGKPTPGPNGGDNESIQNIISAGYHICSAPEEVQCEAILYPGLSMSLVGQNVICNKDVGLICYNKQQGLQQECFDYEIKFKCCGCPTQANSTTLPTSTSSTLSTTVPITTPSTTTTTTPSTTTETTTQPPTTTSTTTTPSTTVPTTTPSTPSTTVPTTTPSTTTTTTPSTTTQTTTQPPTTTSTTTTPSITVPTTTPSTTTTTTPSTTTETPTTSEPPISTPCPGGHDVTCEWSEWINHGKPTPGPNGGDNESIQNIISAGYHICSAPEEVQCESILYPGLSMSLVGQNVICNKDVGLICYNKQQGLQQECFDYEIKFKCCGSNYNTFNSLKYSSNYNTFNYDNHYTIYHNGNTNH